MDRDELRIHLEADDDASPDIARVENAFDRLRAKYEAVAREMESHGLNISTEGVDASIKKMEANLGNMFDRIGAHAEAMGARIWTETNKAAEQAQAAAEKAAARQSAAAQRVFETQRAQMASHVEAYLSGQRHIADAAEKTAQAQILANRKSERELEDFDHRLAQAAQKQASAEARSREETFFIAQDANQKIAKLDMERAAASTRAAEQAAQAERKYREDLFFFTQGENQKLEQEEARRLQHQQAMEEQAAAHRNSTMRNVAGAGLQGAGNILANAPAAIGNIFSTAGGGAMRVMEAGIGAIGNAVRGVTGFFGGLAESIAHTTGRMGEFIAVGVGIYSVYEVVNMVERAFHSLGGAIVEFQDKMVQVQSLRLGEGGALVGDFKDVQAAVLEASMATGRSATELGNALFFIEGHGYKSADALNILTNAAKLSASGLGETDQLVRIVTGQMVAYGAAAEQAGHFFDVFARTEQLAALPIGELSGQFQRLTPITAALHIPIEQVGAAIATISRTGLGASRVVTDLAGVLNSFIHSSPQQQKALEAIGYPIEQLRKDLTEKGLIETLTTIWQRSAHDIDAAGAIFSDRSRALVGFLALVRNSGKDLNDVFDQMANTAGTVGKIFEVNQQRISLQWQRMTATAQAFGIVLSGNILPTVAAAMAGITDALSQGDFVGAWQAFTGSASKAFASVMDMLDGLARSAFGGAYNVAVEMARGLWEGATSAIQAVVDGIADMIASFLLGHSWPPKGPLSQGTAGVQRWQQQYAEAMNQGSAVMTGAAANVATAMNAELGKIGTGGQSKEGLQMAIANIDQQLLPWKLAADSIKDSYNAMLHPLEAQITAIQRIKDLEYDRQQLKFEERDLELRMLKLRAEGDPQRRAQLAGQLAAAQERREQHSIDSRIATLNREARNLRPGRGTTAQEISLRRREIADELQILGLQHQQHKLVNVQLLGQYETKKAQLDVDKEGAGIAHDRFQLEQKQALQPLLEQRDLLKNKMQAELDIIARQTDGLEDQKRALEAQLKLITAREAGQKKAAGGGAGSFVMPEDPLHLATGIQHSLETAAGSLAEGLKTRLHQGMTDFATTYGPRIGQVFMGSIVGGMVLGMPGAIAGAAFGPKLADALTARGVTGANFTGFVTDFMKNVLGTFNRVGIRLRAGDILGSIDELMVSAREWIRSFEAAFFSAWEVSTAGDATRGPGGREGGEATVTRYTGIGRRIVESIKGEMIDGPLDFASLRQAFQTMLGRIYANLTTGVGGYDAGGEMTVGPSPLQQIITAGLQGGSFVLGVVGAAADALAPVFTNLAKNETLISGANALGKAIGVLIMGGTPEGLTSDEGVGKFIEGLAKLDRAMLEAGKKLGQAVANGIWQGIVENFTPGMGSLYIKPGSFLDLVVNGPGALGRGPGALNEDGTAKAPPSLQGAGAAPDLARHLGLPTPTATNDTSPLLSAMPGPAVVAQLGSDAAGGILQGFRDAWASDTSFKEDNSRFWQENVVAAAQDALGTHSPSTVFHQMGDDVLAGFQEVFSSDNTTGAVVRMWLRSEVIAQARSILITGEGKTGGLAAVGIDALEAFGDAFSTPPPSLSINMHSLGQSIVDDIMEPITDPRTGIIAQMRRQIDAMPKAPRHPGADTTLPTPDVNQRYAATGADFIVGGSGGTDSERVNLWATPGERVQVGTSGGGRQVTNHFQFTINGGDPDEIRQAIAAGIQEGMGDDTAVPNQLLNAWRTAKAQGATKPVGTQARGARG